MSRHCTQIEWDDVPHLHDEEKKSLWESIPPYQRDARAKGIPVLGSGVIYPVPESAFVVNPCELPNYWPRAYALDVGWNVTASVWGAWDRQDDCVYIYSEHYRGQVEPSVHADAIKMRGAWIWGAIDPASSASNQKDGTQLIQEYAKLGLNLVPADNTVEAGIHATYRRLSTGRLKIFRSCPNLLGELRIYRRDEKGKIIKEKDHCCDALRYLIMTGLKFADIDQRDIEDEIAKRKSMEKRSSVTGY